jgi:hypothetical protein
VTVPKNQEFLIKSRSSISLLDDESECVLFFINVIELNLSLLRQGDLTQLNATAIVNTTNESMTDRNALSETIFHKSGPELRQEIKTNVKCEYREIVPNMLWADVKGCCHNIIEAMSFE